MNDYTEQAVLEHMNNVRANRTGGNGTQARFYYDGDLDQEATMAAGRNIYKMVERVEVRIPGRPAPLVNIVKPNHVQEFNEAYRAFKSQETKPEAGTLLKEWSVLPYNKMRELADLGISTVDELAVCNESMPQMEFYINEIQAAKDWIEASKEPKNLVPGLKKKIKELEAFNMKLTDQITLLNRQLSGQ